MSKMSEWLLLQKELEELLDSGEYTQEYIEDLQYRILKCGEEIYIDINMR